MQPPAPEVLAMVGDSGIGAQRNVVHSGGIAHCRMAAAARGDSAFGGSGRAAHSMPCLLQRYAALSEKASPPERAAVRRGEVLGFLGPNGAGKTTTMQILSGNLAPSSGRVVIAGHDLLEDPRQAQAP